LSIPHIKPWAYELGEVHGGVDACPRHRTAIHSSKHLAFSRPDIRIFRDIEKQFVTVRMYIEDWGFMMMGLQE
jgi:hypothetical protein